MAIKELFYDSRPQVLLDPRASQRIDPRFKFTRASIGTYFDRDGLIKTASQNQPRFNYNPVSKEYLGFLLEPSRTNLIPNSNAAFTPSLDSYLYGIPLYFATSNPFGGLPGTGPSLGYFGVTSGKDYAITFYAKRASTNTVTSLTCRLVTFIGANLSTTSQAVSVTADGGRVTLNVTSTANGQAQIQLFCGPSQNVLLGGFQVEQSTFPTSYIPTSGIAITRAADLLSVESPLPATGSVYIDARAITANENDTLLSLKNSSNDKIDLGFFSNAATYNSVALIANYDGTSKSSLPLPVPTTDRERNIITYGSQNYQYGSSTARFATSLSSSVPTDLNKLSIGHDAVDPTKAFNGYINSAYLWSGELTPAVAEALVRSELDPIDADTFVPTGPAGSLSIVINTQGAAADGDKVFELPAESDANDNDIVITWGDQTESGLEGAAAELGAPGLTKTYTAAGIYAIFVEGQLENLKFNNSASAPDLVQIVRWGTTANGNDVFLSPSTMNGAFYGCSQLDFSSVARTTSLPDTSAVADWTYAFRGCSSITGIFPQFNFSGATNFNSAWRDCSSLTAFTAAGGQPQNVTNFSSAWYNCSGLTSFPNIDTSAGTNFSFAWYNCSSLTSFPPINTAAGTNFNNAWLDCSNLTSFPLINTAAGTGFSNAWRSCSSLDNVANAGETTSFPLINTAAGTDFSGAWYNCSSFTVFPLINTAAGENFSFAWLNCSSLTNFPLIDTGAGTNFESTWNGCTSLTIFPLIDTSAGTNFIGTWFNCSSLDNVANAGETTSFPLIDTAAGTNFSATWFNCNSFTSFPLINTSSGTNFSQAWRDNDSLAAFPALDFDSCVGSATDSGTSFTGFRGTWQSCGSLTTFPANLFNNTTCTRYLDAFTDCALTAASIENILVSIEAASTNNGNLSLQGGTNAAQSTWTTAATNAYNALVGRGWTITFNP